MKKVIITGGTGAIGSSLISVLEAKGYNVIILSRYPTIDNKKTFFWDFKNKIIDTELLKDTYAIIHLAGANIAEKRWTEERKLELTESRVASLEFLYQKFKEINTTPKVIVSSSAIGFYGSVTSTEVFNEENLVGNDFVAQLSEKWEQAALNFENLNTRVVILRTGVVLSNQENGMLHKILPIFKLGLGSAIGKGNQFFPWIHLEDIVSCFDFALEKENLQGIYNAVAPEHITNNQFSKKLAEILNKPFFLPAIPKFIMKLIFGELECILTEGTRISSEKIINANFQFKYNNATEALKNILTK